MPADPFTIMLPARSGLLGLMARIAAPVAARAAGFDLCRALYARLQGPSCESFVDRVLRALDIVADCDPSRVLLIPERGGLIVASNHPSGALDGLLLMSAILRVRPDVRLLANHLLAGVPELAAISFFADPFGGKAASARSLSGLRAARRWVGDGGTLIAFPSGEVAHQRRNDGSYADSPWHTTVARLAMVSGAKIVPAFIAASNRRRFYAAGRVHGFLRTAMLPRELLAKRGERITIGLGAALWLDEPRLAGLDAVRLTQHVREQVEALEVRHRRSRRRSDEQCEADSRS